MASNYSIFQATKDVISGNAEFVTPMVQARRLLACRFCAHLLAGVTCRRCGCFVHVKARFQLASCPDRKW